MKTGNNVRADRVPPHNTEAEKSALGCALLDGEAAAYIFGALAEDDFYEGRHGAVFSAMRRVFEKGKPVDRTTLSGELDSSGTAADAGGMTYISEIIDSVPSAANFKHYCEIIQYNSVLRRLIKAARNINDNAYEYGGRDKGAVKESGKAALEFAEKQIFDIGAKLNHGELRHIGLFSDGVFNRLELISGDKTALRGIPTGFTDLDRVTNGLQRSDLVLIAARPSVGKTALGMNIIRNIARAAKKKSGDGSDKFTCAVFSLEMSAEQLYQRMLCGAAGVSMSRALGGGLSRGDWADMWRVRKDLDAGEVYIDDSSLVTPGEILSKCRRLKIKKGGLDVVLIDYLQLMYSGSRADNRQGEIAEITRRLKIAAKELNVPVVLLSQMSREVEKRQNHRPQLSDLRESGAIEQDADIVMFIHRKYDKDDESVPPEQRNEIELIIAKHRNGETKSVPLYWHGETVSFRNYSRDTSSPPSPRPAASEPEPESSGE